MLHQYPTIYTQLDVTLKQGNNKLKYTSYVTTLFTASVTCIHKSIWQWKCSGEEGESSGDIDVHGTQHVSYVHTAGYLVCSGVVANSGSSLLHGTKKSAQRNMWCLFQGYGLFLPYILWSSLWTRQLGHSHKILPWGMSVVCACMCAAFVCTCSLAVVVCMPTQVSEKITF